MISFKETKDKIESSEQFKAFRKKYPKSFLTAGFFIIDNEVNQETKQLDYATDKSEKKELITFILNEGIQEKKEETIRKEKFHELESPKIELNEAIGIMKKETKNLAVQYSKIIAVLQVIEKEGKTNEIWNLTCLAGFNVFRLQIDAMTGKVIKEENSNLMDLMKIEKGNKDKEKKEKESKEKADYVG